MFIMTPVAVMTGSIMRSLVMLVLVAALSGCATTVDKNLEFERVCWGDGVCHVVEKDTGRKYYPPDHHECR